MTSSTKAQATPAINTNLVFKSPSIPEKLKGVGLNLNAFVKASNIQRCLSPSNFLAINFGFRLIQFMQNTVSLTGLISGVFTTYHNRQKVREASVNKK
jgi:hypothetical protein